MSSSTVQSVTEVQPRRARWAAVGAAIAVTIGSGGLMSASATIGSGERAVFVPITPCRLMDTRSAPLKVGPRSTPLGAGETHTIAVLGANGNCTIPVDAVGLVLNVAAVNPTAGSFLTVFPSDAPKPLAASLNWVAGQPPVSNAVTTDISADGKVSFFNFAGTVDLAADVVGYYADHNHDDRYALKPTGTSRLLVDPASFRWDGEIGSVRHNFAEGRIEGGPVNPFAKTCATAPVALPQGVTITDVTAHVADSEPLALHNVDVKLWRNPIGVETPELMFTAATSGTPGNITLTGTSVSSPVVDNTQYSYFASVCDLTTLNFLYDMIIGYTNP